MEVLQLTPPRSTNNVPDDSSPSSPPRHAFTMEEAEEAPLGEVRAAIPFLWELTPGTPKEDFEMPHVELEEEYDDDDDSSDEASVSPPLRLPPRLQHLSPACSSDGISSKVTKLCGFMRSSLGSEEEVTVLGMQPESRRKHRIHRSSLRFLSSSSETSLSRDSLSSSSSSFSSSSTTSSLRKIYSNSPDGSFSSSSTTSPQTADEKGRRLNDLVPDTASVVAPKGGRPMMMVESRRELQVHKQQQVLDGDSNMEKRSPPPASAKSIPSSSRREHLGRALFANRLGLLSTCLRELPH